jgi:hypothetical protein
VNSKLKWMQTCVALLCIGAGALAEVRAGETVFDSARDGLWKVSSYSGAASKPRVEETCLQAKDSKELFETMIPARFIERGCHRQVISKTENAVEVRETCEGDSPGKTFKIKGKRSDSLTIETSKDAGTSGEHAVTKIVHRYRGPCSVPESSVSASSGLGGSGQFGRDPRCAECTAAAKSQRAVCKTLAEPQREACRQQNKQLSISCSLRCATLH